MKKIFLTSAALAMSCISGSLQAETAPQVMIAGKGQMVGYSYKNKGADTNPEKKAKGNGESFSTTGSRIDFIVRGETNFLDGVEYDWVISLDGSMHSTYHLKTNRVRFVSKYGTLLVGNHLGAESMMPGTYSIMQGTGGFHGEYKEVVDRPDGVRLGTENPLSTAVLTKVTYITPRFYGFSGKVSWTPLTHLGAKAPQPDRNRLADADNDPYYRHNVITGVDFKYLTDCGINFAVGGTYGSSAIRQSGKYAGIEFKRAQVYTVGANVGYQGWSIGGEYQDATKAGVIRDINQANDLMRRVNFASPQMVGQFNLGKAWNTAVGYKFGDHAVGVGYLDSQRKYNGDKVKAHVYSATYQYKVAPGLNLFSEFNHANMKTGKNAHAFESKKVNDLGTGESVKNNKANVFMIGTSLNF